MPVSRCNLKQMYLCYMVNVLFWNEMKMKENKRKKKNKKYGDSQIFGGNKYWNKRKKVFSGELLVFYIY